MFKTFFLTELRYTLKQPMVYIFLGLLALLTFGATASDNVQIGSSVGNVLRNSPHVVTIYTTIMSLFGLLIATAFLTTLHYEIIATGLTKFFSQLHLAKQGFSLVAFLAHCCFQQCQCWAFILVL